MKAESKEKFTMVKSRDLWSRVDSLITQQKVSKRKLAEICGVGPSAITKWATGGGIDAGNIAKIALHFGVSSDWLLGLQDGANLYTHKDLPSPIPPIKKLKISELRKAVEGMMKWQEGMTAALSSIEKALDDLERE